jgi:hypothetical protein
VRGDGAVDQRQCGGTRGDVERRRRFVARQARLRPLLEALAALVAGEHVDALLVHVPALRIAAPAQWAHAAARAAELDLVAFGRGEERGAVLVAGEQVALTVAIDREIGLAGDLLALAQLDRIEAAQHGFLGARRHCDRDDSGGADEPRNESVEHGGWRAARGWHGPRPRLRHTRARASIARPWFVPSPWASGKQCARCPSRRRRCRPERSWCSPMAGARC